MFVKKLKSWLSYTGVKPSNFSWHSLRIGCATLSSQSGFAPHEIKDFGKWTSNAYIGYIQPPVEYSTAYASRLLSQSTTPIPTNSKH